MKLRLLLAAVVAWCVAWHAAAAEYTLDYTAPRKASVAAVADAQEEGASGEDSPFIAQAVLPEAAVLRPGALAAGDTLNVKFFADAQYTLRLGGNASPRRGVGAFAAKVDGVVGDATVVQTANGLQMVVLDTRKNITYTVATGGGGVHVKALDNTKTGGECGFNDSHVHRHSAPVADGEGGEGDGSGVPTPSEGEVGDAAPATVDIMIVVDSAAKAYMRQTGYSSAWDYCDLAVAQMNTILANTELDEAFSFRLVDVMELAGVVADDCEDALNLVTYPWYYKRNDLSAIADRRDACGADIVSVLIDTGSNYGVTGISWGLQEPFVAPYADFADLAINVCNIRNVVSSYTLAHECGHNMGAGHTDINDGGGPQLFSYSAGAYFYAEGAMHATVMAYPQLSPSGSSTRVGYFSSPNHTYGDSGVRVGDATHDNTRTLRETCRHVAAFREAIAEDDVPGALDYEDLNYYTALPGKWRTTDDPALTHDGEDALVSSRTSEGESVFKVYVGGEGELSFWMKASDAAAGHISISCAGAALLSAEASDYAEWTHLTLPVEGDGLHTVSITYTREEDAVDDFMIIDEMAWSSQTVYTVEFDGGEHGTITGNASQLVVYGASAEAPEVEGDKGWEFDGFDTDFSSVTGNLKVTAQWRRKTFTVVFVSQGKRVRTIKRPFESAVGAVPSASREGWEFVGWVATLEDGSSVTVDAATEVLEDMTAVAQWRAREFTITFDPNGGTGGGTKITMTGTAVGSASALKQGYVLEGWYTAAEGGQYVAPYTLALADATYYAHWRKLGGGDSEEIDDGEDEGGEGDGGEGSESGSNEGEGEGASGNGGGSGVDEGGAVEEEPVDEDEDLEGLDTSKASVFNGYLASADGKPAGTIVLKVGKAAKRTGMSAVTATIQVAGVAKKTVLKDSVAFTADAPTEVAIGELKLAVAADSFKGKYGTLAAMGVKTQDASAYAAWKGKTYAAVIGREGTSGFTLVSMKIGARGKVKVKAVLPTGKTATGSAQLLPGADAAAIPVTLAKANVAFVLKIADGDVAADGVAASGEPETASASTAGIGLPSSFAVDGLKVSGLRISVQKATGFIKGSFTVAVASQKVKFTLNGVVIDDVLYLNAYNKITGVLALAVDGEE